MISRALASRVRERLEHQPGVVLLGPRQVGKTTLARAIAEDSPGAVLLDLERAADRARVSNPELFFTRHENVLVVLDEVQGVPELFTALRPEIDRHRRPGRFLLLGSATGRLLHQSAESLAGRVAYEELTPFLLAEIGAELPKLWVRGGFPPSFTAGSDEQSVAWRRDFVQTLLTRDLPQLGIGVPAETMRRFWQMCAHVHGQLFNASQLGLALGGVSHTTVGRYLDHLVDAMFLRRLEPFLANTGKRLVKAPKVYVRDAGLLHAILGLGTLDALLGHPVAGHSWEGFVVEQLLAVAPPLASWGFYRTSAGAELDLVIEHAGRRVGFEIKLSSAPAPTRGFWNACEDLAVHRAYVVGHLTDGYPLAESVDVVGPAEAQRIVAALAA